MTSTERMYASAWFKSRPPAVQAMFRQYQDKPIFLEGFEEVHWLVGVTQEVKSGLCGLWVSTITLDQDYDRAMATKFKVCACCMKRVHVPAL